MTVSPHQQLPLRLKNGGQTSGTESPESTIAELKAIVQDLVNRCKALHSEVEAYVAAVEEKKLTKTADPVEYRPLRTEIKTELDFLQKLIETKSGPEKIRNHISSSNLVYWEALWAAAKRSEGLLAFRKYFFWNRQQDGLRAPYQGLSLGKGAQMKGKTAALADIVARDGREWIRISTMSEKKLLFDLAKLGWRNDSDSDSDADGDDAVKDPLKEEDDEDEVPIVKQARELARAARANPICGNQPQVRLVLTRIQSGKHKEVDRTLDKIRATGAIVQCSNEISPAPTLQDVLPKLLVDRSRTLTDTLNIDCTILLALISDISHQDCPILDWYPGEVRAQIKEERREKLLPTHLYPAIGSRSMVCTQEAADQMYVIVDTLATDTEKTRASLLLGQRQYSSLPQPELRRRWQGLSVYPMPAEFQLPIKVVPSNIEALYQKLPNVAKDVAKTLDTPVNQAIFLYGWGNGITTLSSNRARARQIESVLNEKGLKDGEAGPHIWLCGESRSLIAKQGRRRQEN